METYPFDLILAVAVASVTVFLGFLPAKNLPSAFFAREAFKATIAWVIIAAISPLAVMHYPFILAVFSFVAWWSFQRDDTFTGKIWLSVASGLGISIGVLVILAVTPGSLPGKATSDLATTGSFHEQAWDWGQAGCLSSLYLGGAITGLAYVCFLLCQEATVRAGLGGFLQNGLGLLYRLTLIRGGIVLLEIALVRRTPAGHNLSFDGVDIHPFGLLLVGVCVVLVLPTLAYLARRSARLPSRQQPIRLLLALMLAGFVTEIIARVELL